MVPKAKILVVDDEATLRLVFDETLTRDGYQVMSAATGQAALALMESEIFDLALIDLKLGDMDGLEVLVRLREKSPETVAIMLTAHASLETVVEALRQGAHDYLFKPCPVEELRNSIQRGILKLHRERQQRNLLRQLEQQISHRLADIQAVIAGQDVAPPVDNGDKQPGASYTPGPDNSIRQSDNLLQGGDLIVDYSGYLIMLDGHPLPLTVTEFNLLAYLIRHMPRIISPQELVREVQGYHSEPWEACETVRAHIYHIRHKIKKATGHKHVVGTVRGKGYTIIGPGS